MVDSASTGTPRFVEEEDVVFCEAGGGWAIVPTQRPLDKKKNSKWFRDFILASFSI
jgi:hypothetical protein